QEVGRRLYGGDTEPADVLREAWLGDRDAVLYQLLRFVEVGPELEGDGELHLPVGRRLRRHVEHVFDAVDLLLDRRRDRLGDDLRRRPGVAGGDDDRGRHDLRVLRNREGQVRDGTDDQRHDGDDGGEDRSVDEEAGDVHRLATLADASGATG